MKTPQRSWRNREIPTLALTSIRTRSMSKRCKLTLVPKAKRTRRMRLMYSRIKLMMGRHRPNKISSIWSIIWGNHLMVCPWLIKTRRSIKPITACMKTTRSLKRYLQESLMLQHHSSWSKAITSSTWSWHVTCHSLQKQDLNCNAFSSTVRPMSTHTTSRVMSWTGTSKTCRSSTSSVLACLHFLTYFTTTL